MSVVLKMSEWPRPQVREPKRPQARREAGAEIHILPCIRREPLQERAARLACIGAS